MSTLSFGVVNTDVVDIARDLDVDEISASGTITAGTVTAGTVNASGTVTASTVTASTVDITTVNASGIVTAGAVNTSGTIAANTVSTTSLFVGGNQVVSPDAVRVTEYVTVVIGATENLLTLTYIPIAVIGSTITNSVIVDKISNGVCIPGIPLTDFGVVFNIGRQNEIIIYDVGSLDATAGDLYRVVYTYDPTA